MRAAAVGGTAYAIGRRRAQRQDDQAYEHEAAQSSGLSETNVDELERLGKLKEQGILTDAEFAQQKEKILAGT
jgi:hypothetical protein